MQTVRSPRTAAVLFLLLACLARPAAAESGKDAKKIYEEATAAFGLGKYAVAAEKYEAAFAIRPDPALLYNAAQSYRLAGNKPRALELRAGGRVRRHADAARLPGLELPDGWNADADGPEDALLPAVGYWRPPGGGRQAARLGATVRPGQTARTGCLKALSAAVL